MNAQDWFDFNRSCGRLYSFPDAFHRQPGWGFRMFRSAIVRIHNEFVLITALEIPYNMSTSFSNVLSHRSWDWG